jgi:hypothetical protein
MTFPENPSEAEEVLTTPATPGAAALPTEPSEDDEAAQE